MNMKQEFKNPEWTIPGINNNDQVAWDIYGQEQFVEFVGFLYKNEMYFEALPLDKEDVYRIRVQKDVWKEWRENNVE